ncbi:MAG: molybdopterin-dependent oxidoreductase, partial [Sphingobacterium sp.]
GGVPMTDATLIDKLKKTWNIPALPEQTDPDIYSGLEDGKLKNIFIFGEDPLGCTGHKVQTAGWLTIADFVVVQDYFMTETAQHAHLILPASLPVETGGSFTNTQKVIQEFEALFTPAVEKTGLAQLADLLKAFGIEQKAGSHEVLAEVMSLLPTGNENITHQFIHTQNDNPNRIYGHGCDHIVMRFDDEFAKAFENVKIDLYERI